MQTEIFNRKFKFKIDILNSPKEIITLSAILLTIFFVNLGFIYKDYLAFTKNKFVVKDAIILAQYQKSKISKTGKPYTYTVFRLDMDGHRVYTSLRDKNLKDLTNYHIKATFISDKVDFVSYMRGFYAPSFYMKVYEKKEPNILTKYFKSEHKDSVMSNLYTSLFFGDTVGLELRSYLTKYGINHLIAISGFHLAFISLFIYLIFAPIYKFFQDRYFPYRSRTKDMGYFIFSLLFMYLVFLDFNPSFMRAFIMSFLLFFLYLREIDIRSFKLLFLVIVTSIALIPNIMFSVGFFYSVMGVFYIYLFLKYIDMNNIFKVIAFNFIIYINMLIIVHFIFPYFSIISLISPILSMLFALFYPLSFVFHILNLGDILDSFLLWVFKLEFPHISFEAPSWLFYSYLFASLTAMFHKYLYILVNLVGIIFLSYLILHSI